MRALGAALSLVALGACGRPAAPAYPPQYEINFMRACEAQGASADFCRCVWNKIEAEIPADDFAALERLPASERAAHPLQSQIETYAASCNSAQP